MKTKLGPLQELLAMSVGKRLNAVAKDLRARRKRYNKIDEFDLADALGVETPRRPGDGWWFAHYAEKVTAEECASNGDGAGELIYRLEGKVPAERFEVLRKKAEQFDEEGGDKFTFLKARERKLLEDGIAEEELEANQMNGMHCFARFRLKAPSGKVLWFEAGIEDDGICIRLRTP